MTPGDEDAEALLRLAVDAASEAGALLASWRGDIRPEVIDTKSSPTDVVTEMDRRSEALITERIREARPGDTVLGEEGGQTAGATVPDGTGAGDRGTPAAPEPVASRLYFYEDHELLELARKAGFAEAHLEHPDFEPLAREAGIPEEHLELFKGHGGGQLLVARKE